MSKDYIIKVPALTWLKYQVTADSPEIALQMYENDQANYRGYEDDNVTKLDLKIKVEEES